MSAIKTFFADLRSDEDGASFLEYTVLLGIILAVTIATVTSVGSWAGSVWTLLCGSVAASGIGSGTGACAAG